MLSLHYLMSPSNFQDSKNISLCRMPTVNHTHPRTRPRTHAHMYGGCEYICIYLCLTTIHNHLTGHCHLHLRLRSWRYDLFLSSFISHGLSSIPEGISPFVLELGWIAHLRMLLGIGFIYSTVNVIFLYANEQSPFWITATGQCYINLLLCTCRKLPRISRLFF